MVGYAVLEYIYYKEQKLKSILRSIMGLNNIKLIRECIQIIVMFG